MRETKSVKATVKNRSLNVGKSIPKKSGAPFDEQDPKRRLGNFTTTGEHARQGGGQPGLVGQTKQKFRTDKKSSNK
jgi:hypothetical protein